MTLLEDSGNEGSIFSKTADECLEYLEERSEEVETFPGGEKVYRFSEPLSQEETDYLQETIENWTAVIDNTGNNTYSGPGYGFVVKGKR